MKLIVGLGNPGKRYAHNRHNIGFHCIDLLAKRNSIQIKRSQCQSKLGGGAIGGVEVVLARPQTFVNVSGEAVKGLMQKYRISIEDLVIICDNWLADPNSDPNMRGDFNYNEIIDFRDFAELGLAW